jgi:hypothetical protein
MKTRLFFISLMILLIIGGCTKEKKSPVEGAWNLVSWQHFAGDTVVWTFPGDYTGTDLVIFSERHLLSVGRFIKDTTYMNNYVGASYTLDGNHFEETLLYFPNSNMVGQTNKQLLELRNDTLIKSYPCDNNWELKKSEYSVEKYVRPK